ncbi:glycoside hydrolase family 38 N-terminal domain-containing protein [Microbacterium resistens]|uniref:glycoside hydrolase family 38 N-terminal domain-containing protein n=1 Tax=Microbacterium resistens TaxID=156977 RepID=UPI00366E960B
MSSEIVVVPHTHWDREWYEPHDVFRLRLVHMLDRLLALLEEEPAYRFTLDGQAAAIEDYLEMRPENRDRVVALVEEGRLSLGPFLILLDEFACDGETIVRNLELGRAASARLGGAMPVGYLPDMFGHAAQMPQILRGFGIRHGALWRGAPAAVREHAFAWTAPNGDAVRCEYLFDGYGNGLDMFALAGQLADLAPDYAARTASWYGEDPVLAMLGTDHSAPPEDLAEVVAAYDALGGAPRMSIATLDEHLARYGTDEAALERLPAVRGELRSHARGNLLPGVFSIRTNLKAEMGRTERALAAAERLDLVFGSRDHRRFFDTAWYRLVESTAHDSVTGCGVDATAEQVGTRIHTAGHIARGVIDSVMRDLARGVTPAQHLVFNPAGAARRTQVEVTLHDAEARELSAGVQLLDPLPTVLGDERLRTADLPKILRRIHGRELFGQQINGYAWGASSLRFRVAESPEGVWDLAAFTAELEERVAADPEGEAVWHVETIADPRRRALLAADVPGLGLAAVSETAAPAPTDPVRVTARSLANAALTATVADDGTVRIEAADGTVLDGALAIVDDGDRGDSYNYGPVADEGGVSSSVTTPRSVEIVVQEEGPLRGRILVRRAYDVPEGLDESRRRSSATVPLVVETTVELREGEPFLRVGVDHVNTASDHRLRVLVPVGGVDLDASRSAGQYGITVRGREAEGGWGEYPLPTYPAYRFAAAGRAAVLVRKLTEYELVSAPGADDALALTLSRSVGMMSVNLHPLRDEPAGSEIPVPGAQYLGVAVHTDLAILPSSDDAAVVRASDLFRHDPIVVRGTGERDLPLPAPAVAGVLDGDVVLESARRVDDQAELRFVNYLEEERVLGFAAPGAWTRTDLDGRPEGAADPGSLSVPGGQVVTIRRRLDT